MNKYLAWLPASLLIIGLAVYKPVKEASKDHFVDKSVSISVFRNTDYNTQAYQSTSARVYVIIEKVSSKGKRSTVWEKSFEAKTLVQYPLKDKAIEQNVNIHNVNDKKEHLEVKYVLIYDSKGCELQMQDQTVITGSYGNVAIRI